MAPHALVEYAGDTNVGMKRNHNEDFFSVFEDESLYIVADGMGGHASGEVASKMAVETLREFFSATSADPEVTWPYKMDRSRGYEENRLITGVKLANLRIYEAAQREPKYRGMGTTVCVLFFVDGGAYIGHVGDSRVYRIRGPKMTQVTEDHSLLNDYIKMKKLTEWEWKDIMTAALKKSQVVPGIDGGFVVLGQHTSSMSKADFSELIELILAFGADHDVHFSDRDLEAHHHA